MSVVFPIQPNDRFTRVIASAGQTVLAFSFPVQSANDLQVFIRGESGGETVLDYGFDYSIAGVGEIAGGSVTLSTPALDGQVFYIVGAAVLDRTTSIVTAGRFASGLQDAEHDRHRIIQQELHRDVERSLKVAYGDPVPDITEVISSAETAISASAAALGAANGQYTFDTMAAAAAANIPAIIHGVYLRGKASRTDGLGGLWVQDNNGSDDTFVSADGRTWWRAADVSSSKRIKRDRFIDAAVIVQAKLMELDMGGALAPIYSQATNALQGVSIITFGGNTLLFATQRVGGSNWDATERQRLIMATLGTNGNPVGPTIYTDPLNLGHGYDLTARVEAGEIYLYSSETINPLYTGANAGKGFTRTHWKGLATAQADVQTFAVWGQVGSGHPYEKFNRAGVGVSPDGSRVWLVSAPVDGAASRRVMCYDLPAVMAAGAPLNQRPLYEFDLTVVIGQGANVIQGIADDGFNLVFAVGGTDPFGQNGLVAVDFKGNILRGVAADLATAQYGLDGILNNATHGHPWRFEPEGACPYRNGFVVSVAESWYGTAKIVSWKGANWACVTATDTTGVPPSNGAYWIRTTKAATDGAWDAAINYAGSGTLSFDKKTLYYVGPSLGLPQEQPVNNGIRDMPDPSALKFGQGSDATTGGFQWRNVFSIRAWAERLGVYFNALEYDGAARWKVFDQRFDSDNAPFVSMQANFTATLKAMVLRAKGTTAAEGAAIRIHAADDPTYPYQIIEVTGSAGTFRRQTDQYGNTMLAADAGVGPLTLKSGTFSITVYIGSGSPSGVVTASPGAFYIDVGGAFHFKTSGTGNTGWTLK